MAMAKVVTVGMGMSMSTRRDPPIFTTSFNPLVAVFVELGEVLP
jgi:hypothetical protein